MQKTVEASYKQAKALRRRNPEDELRLLLRDLRLPKEAFPKLPETLTAAAMDGNVEAVKQCLPGENIDQTSVG